MQKITFKNILILLLFLGAACTRRALPEASSPAKAVRSPVSAASTKTATQTAAPSVTPARLPAIATYPPTSTFSPAETVTATNTPVPSSPTPAATDTPGPTSGAPVTRVLMQANCRYGPGRAYLYSYGLYAEDKATIDGRSAYGKWYWIQPENLDRHCWAAASVLDYAGSDAHIPVVTSRLPQSTLYGPPANVSAVREGDHVLVRWDPVWMTQDDDRGYLIEAFVCQNGGLVWTAVHTDKPSYEFFDEGSCSPGSSGKLYTVEKHGYTASVPIPWPE